MRLGEKNGRLFPSPSPPPSLSNMWSRGVTRWFRFGLSVPGPFGRRCLNSLAMLRFHSPLIEPGGRFSRTGLSDKNSCVRPREALRPCTQADQTQLVVEVLIGEP